MQTITLPHIRVTPRAEITLRSKKVVVEQPEVGCIVSCKEGTYQETFVVTGVQRAKKTGFITSVVLHAIIRIENDVIMLRPNSGLHYITAFSNTYGTYWSDDVKNHRTLYTFDEFLSYQPREDL